MTRQTAVLALGLAGLAAVIAAVFGLRGGSQQKPSTPTARAARADVVVSVGGLGKIVAAGAAARIATPAPAASGGSGSGSSSAGGGSVPPGAVFAGAAGRVARLLVGPGQSVSAGQPVALLDDGGTSRLAIDQARADLASARLELAQKRRSDTTKGQPPTQAELHAARVAVDAARQKQALVDHPAAADVTAARLDVRKATADLETLRRPPATKTALEAARIAVDVARQKLSHVDGPPSPVDVAAAQAELKKAQADLDTLRTPPPGPSDTALQAAQLAVTLAQRKLAELPAAATPTEVLAAQADLKKAQADLEALQKPSTPPPSQSAIAAAQAAVDLAQQKLAQITGPPSQVVVSAAFLDLVKAAADLSTLERGPLPAGVDAAQLGVRLSRERLARVLSPPAAVRTAAQLDVAKAQADLQVLERRGGPASPTDLALAQLKVDAAGAHLTVAEEQAARLTVRASAGGTVTSVLTAPGAPTDASTPVVSVSDLRHVAVSVDLSEFDAAQVRGGLPAVVSVDALGGRKLPGRVLFAPLAGVDNGGVVTFPVRVSITSVAGVRPGMNASVRIIVAQRRNVVTVPLEAVSRGSGAAHVTVVDASGRATPRRVSVGLADNKIIEITRGLRPGERVELGGGGGA